MIVVGYNGFGLSAELFSRLYNRHGRDRNRIAGHDASAAIFVDGKLVAAAEEERFTRVKKTSAFPINAIRYCLQQAEVDIHSVDLFAFPWLISEETVEREFYQTLALPIPIKERYIGLGKRMEVYEKMTSTKAVRSEFIKMMGIELPAEKFMFVPHHISHIMCGYYLSGWSESAFLITDGRGEQVSSIMGHVERDQIRILENSAIDVKNSLGQLYLRITRYLGFMPNNDEYKVMALGPFAKPEIHNPLMEKFITLEDNGKYRVGIGGAPWFDDKQYENFLDELFEISPTIEKSWDFKCRVARYMQEVIERVTAHQVHYLEQQIKTDTLIIEGGVAMNCVNNQKLLENSRFHDVKVSFGASDPGVSIGAGYYPFYLSKVEPKEYGTAYLGPEFDEQSIYEAIQIYEGDLEYQELTENELCKHISVLLRDKVVIAWFQGQMEYGPRALGNRSILANPQFDDIQEIINEKVKKRESFRPFAPVITEESANLIFDFGKKKASPYMTFVFPVRSEYRSKIPGVLHVDNTARVQTVNVTQNARLYTLLREFESLGNPPCLINTSFNVAGEPIVCTPVDAVRCFLGTTIDYLILNNVVIKKKWQNTA